MKKLLITKRLTALLWALVLTLMPMNLMADNYRLSVTVTDELGGFTNETASNAFDDDSETKWCGGIRTLSGANAYVEVRLAEKSKLDYYYLWTSKDINYEDNDGKQQRNPKEWKLYAKVNEGDKWTLISHVTNAGLPTEASTRSDNYKIDAAYQNIEYNYLKFEILQVEQGTIFEVDEICFINCNHEFVDDICTECGYRKLSLLSFTIAESLGGFKWEGPEKAIDGITTNKWCGDFSEGNPYVVLKNDGKAKLVNYCLYSGNDLYSDGKDRNLTGWKLYAKEKASDEWTVISHVTDPQMPSTKSTRSKDYTIAEDFRNTYYKFFKFEILGVGKGDIYVVGELCLMGYPCHHQFDEESVICSICGDIKEHEHVYDDGIVTKEPTCTEPGEKTYTCSRCGETEPEKMSALLHTINDDLKCTVCGYEITADCIIEYTATEKLSNIEEGIAYDYEFGEEAVFDYTDKDPYPGFKDYENFGEELFGVPAIKHEYDKTTQKGRIICNAPVTKLERFTYLRPERLTSFTLPSTVKVISSIAFYDCSNITSITLLAEYSDDLEYDLELVRCNNLQEIIVPYNSYHKYIEACDSDDCIWYEDENGEEHKGDITDYFKSLLSLDDTKTFETPESEVKVDATLQRSFANDGWYSLCVPFSVSVADSPFYQVAEFSELDGDTYKFTTVDNIEAGKAYIVKVDAAVANPTFKNVFIDTKAPATEGDFIGVYSPTELGAGCKVIGSGTTVNPVNPGTMKGFRAYFPASAAGAKAMRFTVDDGEATDIQSLTEAEGYKLKAKGTFNLAGQKVDENYRGIVVRNGKKVLVK